MSTADSELESIIRDLENEIRITKLKQLEKQTQIARKIFFFYLFYL